MTTPQDRDSVVEKLLKQESLHPHHAVTDECLDAETLAAWMDGGLSGAALETAQSHAYSCARCLALVGAMLRSEPPALAKKQARSGWWLWFVPATAAAAGVAIWFAVPAPTLLSTPRPPAAVAERSREAPAQSEPQHYEEARRAVPGAAAALEAKDLTAPPSLDLAAPAPLEVKRADEASVIQEKLDANQREVARRAAAEAAAAVAAARPVAPTAAANALDAVARVLPAAALPPGAQPAEPPPAAPEPSPAAAAFQGAAGAAADTAASSPAAPVRWRLQGGTVERSADAGATWRRVVTGASALTAVATPSPTVCWIVGRGGVVMRLTDGENFARVTSPDPGDLSSVQATSALSATVTTVDGRRFATRDGGRSWTTVEPQEF